MKHLAIIAAAGFLRLALPFRPPPRFSFGLHLAGDVFTLPGILPGPGDDEAPSPGARPAGRRPIRLAAPGGRLRSSGHGLNPQQGFCARRLSVSLP
jgi:hypothetical protein